MIKLLEKVESSNLDSAVTLCKSLYEVLSKIGIYPALTGGSLYKGGSRKDIDVVLYRNRQSRDYLDLGDEDLQNALEDCGVKVHGNFGFVMKCEWNAIPVDLLNPEYCGEDDYEG